jgi:DNA helicase HerA-like ATPase
VTYGNVSKATVGAVQRALLVLEQQGGDKFFGEPALLLKDLMRTTTDGRGYVNLLAADRLMQSPRLYATFLLWLLAELFEELPEVGDLDKPRLVFFFDEAHLLFNDAPKALVEKIEQVVRLIRSKGVGVYFVTQNPLDVPETVLGQHALRAFTPRDQKAVRAAAETFRPNPAFRTEDAIMQLAVGEALVSTLQDKGIPAVVERVTVAPPRGRIGPLAPDERQRALRSSPLFGQYDQTVDRESAAERLAGRFGAGAGSGPAAVAADDAAARRREMEERLTAAMRVGGAAGAGSAEPAPRATATTGRRRTAAPAAPPREPPSALETIANQVLKGAGSSMARSIGSRAGTALVRGVLGALLKR